MATANVTSKNQITIPAEIRKQLGIRPGTKVEFVAKDGAIEFKAKKTSYKELAGMFHVSGMKAVTPREIDRSISRYLAADDDRIRAQYKSK